VRQIVAKSNSKIYISKGTQYATAGDGSIRLYALTILSFGGSVGSMRRVNGCFNSKG